MSNASSLTGAELLEWAESATRELVARRAEINSLNVFPVPDADTGSNMAHTMEAAVAQARNVAARKLGVEDYTKATSDQREKLTAGDVATALSVGSVRGARGNSGVVLSQVLRGLAQAGNDGEITGESVTGALHAALSFVTRAISDPVEGTVITVLRAAAIAAKQSATTDLLTVAKEATNAARSALAKTPSQLAALREAGVVDAGGQGLVILLETLLNAAKGHKDHHDLAEENADEAETKEENPSGSALSVRTTAPDSHEENSYKANEIFIPGVGDFSLTSTKKSSKDVGKQVSAATTSVTSDSTEEDAQEALSLRSDDHGVHSDGHTPQEESASTSSAPGDGPYLEVMFFAEDVHIDELQQAISPLGDCLVIARLSDNEATVHIHSRQSGKVIETAFQHATVSDLRIEVLPDTQNNKRAGVDKRVVIAVTPPGTLAELYRSAGAIVIPRASEAEDIVQEIVAEARKSGAQEIILLPNGLLEKDELANVERLSLAFEQSITLLATGTLVRGLAALAMHDPSHPLAVDTYTMSEAASAMRTAEIVHAHYARLTQAGPCSKDDLLAVSGNQTLVVGEELVDTIHATLRKLLEPNGEQISLLVDPELMGDITEVKIREGLPAHRNVDISLYPADNLKSLVEIGVE